MNLSENLKRIRKENNLSQEQLAEKLGVSRQSVSKWESNQAYPEMDKVIQLSKMFNLNIDNLLNQDIRRVNNEKQSKIMVNKYIDDFLGFITKTIDLFTSLKFKDKCKCILEQFIIACIMIILFLIIGDIGFNVLYGLISMFPDNAINIITSIFSSIYSIFSLIFGIILLIHIFKVRYLDYYVIVRENESFNEENHNKKEQDNIKKEDKVYLEKKKEKIVIRDPKHSEYKFISGLLKCLLIIIKGFTLIIAIIFCISLIVFILSTILSFLIIKTGLFFLGIFLILSSCIIINLIILVILFNFIMNEKSKKKLLFISFIISLLLFGVGMGFTTIGFTKFDYIDDINNEIYLKDEIIIPMKKDLVINSSVYYSDNFEYIEEYRDNIKIVYEHTELYDLWYNEDYDNYIFLGFDNINNPFIFVREIIEDINNKKIVNYSNFKIYIYASKDNIEKLKSNYNNYLKYEEY